MIKRIVLLLPILMALSLTGCGAPVGLAASAGGLMYATKPGEPPPADTADQIPPHESWCYRTMGEEVECFSEPQDTPAGRLVNVDPPNRYPLTTQAYADALMQSKAADAAALNARLAAMKPVAAPDPGVAAVPVQPVEVTPAPAPPAPKAAPVKPHKPVKHKKKKKKIPPKTPPAALPNPALPPAEPINP